MSRSYKKFPIVKDKTCSKHGKRFANKKVRRTQDIPNGKAYRKVYETWDICDYCWIWTRKDAIKHWYESDKDSWTHRNFETLEEYLIYWEKCVKRK